MKHTQLYERALNKFGDREQIIKCIEELAELSVELCKELNCNGDLTRILNEMADARIMMNQMIALFGEDKFRGVLEWKHIALEHKISGKATLKQDFHDSHEIAGEGM